MRTIKPRNLLLLTACTLSAFFSRTGESAQPPLAIKAGLSAKKMPASVAFGKVTSALSALLPEFSVNLDKSLASSMKKRRDFAWKIVAKVFAPIDVTSSAFTGTIPTWQTWYGEEDFQDIYAAYHKAKATDPATGLGLLKVKNLNRTLSSKNLGKTLKQFERFKKVKGLGTNPLPAPGTGFVTYSPGMIEHMLKSATNIAKCNPDDYPADQKPSTAKNTWGLCLKAEFPKDGVMIKTRWAKLASGIVTYGTTATDMETMWNKSSVGQFASSGTTTPSTSAMYTVTDENGAVWGLEGMHISTKDIRLWTWVSIWWSNSPDSDYGADRPSTVAAALPSLANYKMCIASDFVEKDSDPSSHYRSSDKTKSLADAIDKVKSLANGSQWCANPYLETSFSRSNCVGCHQGAGVNFDVSATTQNRVNGIPDFVYGFDNIKEAIETENAK